jgi:hypothetical protein
LGHVQPGAAADRWILALVTTPRPGGHIDEHAVAEPLDAIGDQSNSIEVTPIVAYRIRPGAARGIPFTRAENSASMQCNEIGQDFVKQTFIHSGEINN